MVLADRTAATLRRGLSLIAFASLWLAGTASAMTVGDFKDIGKISVQELLDAAVTHTEIVAPIADPKPQMPMTTRPTVASPVAGTPGKSLEFTEAIVFEATVGTLKHQGPVTFASLTSDVVPVPRREAKPDKKPKSEPQPATSVAVTTPNKLSPKSNPDTDEPAKSPIDVVAAPAPKAKPSVKVDLTTPGKAQAQLPKLAYNAKTENAIVVGAVKNGEKKTLKLGGYSPVPDALMADVHKALQEVQREEQPLALEIQVSNGAVKFDPEKLAFMKSGQQADVTITAADPANRPPINIFVRDPDMLNRSEGDKVLTATKSGSTEMYVVAFDKMYILPVQVEAETTQPWSLSVPDELVTLNTLDNASANSAAYPSPEFDLPRASNVNSPALSLQDSKSETAAAVAGGNLMIGEYTPGVAEAGYTTFAIQVVDERSAPSAGKIFPVEGAEVKIVGTEFNAPTDNLGHIAVRDLPQNSHMLIAVDDPTGQTVPTVTDVETTSETDSGVSRVRVMRMFTYETLMQVSGVVQDTAFGSICGRVINDRKNMQAFMGVNVELDVEADGPFYFNGLGVIDLSVKSTGENGRFCFFNVSPGPVSVIVTDGTGGEIVQPTAVFAGRHREWDVFVEEGIPATVRLATMATAYQQLGDDLNLANSYRSFDYVDLIPLGAEDALMQRDEGVLETQDPVVTSTGDFWAYAQGAEFEPTIYRMHNQTDPQIVTLIPRGFVEDMAIMSQTAFDPDLGVAVVEFVDFGDLEEGNVNIRLVDEQGYDVGQGWYYGDRPVTKAIFFNINPGYYSLIAETDDGFWLQTDTVYIYNETVTFSRMGSPLRYRP